MAPRKTRAGGGWPALIYSLKKALEVGPWRLWKKMRSRNACKTCALGMGGQLGGMVNEAGHFPEVCKKSLQAQVADMQGAIKPQFFAQLSLAQLLQLTPKQAEDAGRLTFPLLWKEGMEHFQEVSWEKALDTLVQSLHNTTPERAAFYASGRSSNEAAFLLQCLARVYGTNNVMNCSYYCHQASSVALKMAFGTGTATIQLEDLAKADLVFLIGANPASNHPRLMTQLASLKERGGHVIVVNPVLEPALKTFHVPSKVKSMLLGSKIASLYVQPLAGGDVAFLIGVLKALVQSDNIDYQFLQNHTSGWQRVLADANETSWEEIVCSSGVNEEQIKEVADLLASSKKVIFAWAMGLTHHQSGVDNVLALSNLALATGNVGKPGAGMLPIRGHSNVQGIGSIGFAPKLQDGMRIVLEKVYGRAFPQTEGYDTFAMMEAAASNQIDVLVALGGNLWGSNPDSQWAARALQNIGCVAYLSTKLNPGHFHGRGRTTLILPVLARDEEKQSTTQESMFNYVRLSEGGPANVDGDMRAESDLICDLASRLFGKERLDWAKFQDHREIRQLIANCLPGWEEIANIDSKRSEFTIPGRTFHSAQFNTIDGKAVMHSTPIPKQDEELRLISLRSEGQFNTVVYEEADIYRGMPHRHCLLISKEDTEKFGLKDGDTVTVHGEAGSLPQIELVVGGIRPGVVAMFYPESNVLIKGRIDPRSKTPAFKSAPVRIERCYS